jgi:hypothetical protein
MIKVAIDLYYENTEPGHESELTLPVPATSKVIAAQDL